MACGDSLTTSRTNTLAQALWAPPEVLEAETPGVRQELWRELARLSLWEGSQAVGKPVLFPMVESSRLVAARGIDHRMDLFVSSTDGAKYTLAFDGGEMWPEEGREGLHGLSEREAVDMAARSLLNHWKVVENRVRVDRAPGAPYAAAYIDGVLRVNPSFLYLAATAVGAGAATPLQ